MSGAALLFLTTAPIYAIAGIMWMASGKPAFGGAILCYAVANVLLVIAEAN